MSERRSRGRDRRQGNRRRENRNNDRDKPRRVRNVFPRRLEDNYKLLKNSDLIQQGDISDQSLDLLENCLNNSQPNHENYNERNAKRIVYAMFNNDKQGFVEMLKGGKNEFLIFWTNAYAIVEFFGLIEKVYIRWCETHYRVERFERRDNSELASDLIDASMFPECSDDEKKDESVESNTDSEEPPKEAKKSKSPKKKPKVVKKPKDSKPKSKSKKVKDETDDSSESEEVV